MKPFLAFLDRNVAGVMYSASFPIRATPGRMIELGANEFEVFVGFSAWPVAMRMAGDST